MTDQDLEPVERAQLLSPCVLVGGAGRMGEWLRGILESVSLEVRVVEHHTSREETIRLLGDAQMVLFTLPIDQTVSVIKELIPMAPSYSLMCDVTSVKSVVMDVMEMHPGEAVGLHPMCAPIATGLRGQTVVWCEGTRGRRSEALRGVLADLGAQLIDMKAEEHDRLMAVVQVANHFQSFVLAQVMQRLGVSSEEALSVASPIYHIRMQMMGRVLAHDPAMYVDMMLNNPYAGLALDVLVNESRDLQERVAGGEREKCLQFVESAARSLGDFRFEALQKSDALLHYFMEQLLNPS